MNLLESMKERHAVRNFSEEPLAAEQIATLSRLIDELNGTYDLHIQLIHDAEDALGGCPTHYGRFSGVHNLIALIGSDEPEGSETSGKDDDGTDAGVCDDGHRLDEQVGYAGELLALNAVSLGLDTSWVVLHETQDHHGAWTIGTGQRMPAAIALGHGTRPGRPHRSRPAEELGTVANGTYADAPEWFHAGIEAVMLAPSALGKQPVRFELLEDGRTVRAQALDGVQAHICLGIARLHFELGAGTGRFDWA
ncbi:nitroreductase [Bifidobacterium reuteri]|uniref:Nitroreductase family protein n=2 Tax=Bifidobacterium reuteri TaxID=983706 RepID=A0A087CSW8_9BIFI|nr:MULTISPECIES: nitroreductase family protein [Bifidobacterium]KAA8826089.1 nitroreductase [Bifidobacterium reuteri]KFI86368.1 nitroreductase family protein [Bifidobacterium reuteri DSM 23975]TPF78114.1 nitroreductase [Bifidobacterium sp. UTCIF-1]TPF81073.1 nitroreductase [Bifidobacterium sp. UTCIF-24]TPF82078.1 nitroreductase [Bifidobacterium sp. UTCIF-3]